MQVKLRGRSAHPALYAAGTPLERRVEILETVGTQMTAPAVSTRGHDSVEVESSTGTNFPTNLLIN